MVNITSFKILVQALLGLLFSGVVLSSPLQDKVFLTELLEDVSNTTPFLSHDHSSPWISVKDQSNTEGSVNLSLCMQSTGISSKSSSGEIYGRENLATNFNPSMPEEVAMEKQLLSSGLNFNKDGMAQKAQFEGMNTSLNKEGTSFHTDEKHNQGMGGAMKKHKTIQLPQDSVKVCIMDSRKPNDVGDIERKTAQKLMQDSESWGRDLSMSIRTKSTHDDESTIQISHHPDDRTHYGSQPTKCPIFTVPNYSKDGLHNSLSKPTSTLIEIQTSAILNKIRQEEKDYSELDDKLDFKHQTPLGSLYTCADQGKEIIAKYTREFDGFKNSLQLLGHKEKLAVLDLYPGPKVIPELFPAAWKIDNIVFPNFIHKFYWLYGWLNQGNIHTSLSMQNLSTLIHSASEFFTVWVDELSSLFHETLQEFINRTHNLGISHFSNTFNPNNHDQVILQLEYGPSTTNWESLSWALLQRWLFNNHLDVYDIVNPKIFRFKRLHAKFINRSIHVDKIEHYNYQSFSQKYNYPLLLRTYKGCFGSPAVKYTEKK